MAGYRRYELREMLKYEAEMRVRAGESRADVARALGIPLPTLAQWACQDGWRKKDLVAADGGKAIRELGARIRSLRRAEEAEEDRVLAALAELEAALKAEGREMPPGLRSEAQVRMRQRQSAAIKAPLEPAAPTLYGVELTPAEIEAVEKRPVDEPD